MIVLRNAFHRLDLIRSVVTLEAGRHRFPLALPSVVRAACVNVQDFERLFILAHELGQLVFNAP